MQNDKNRIYIEKMSTKELIDLKKKLDKEIKESMKRNKESNYKGIATKQYRPNIWSENEIEELKNIVLYAKNKDITIPENKIVSFASRHNRTEQAVRQKYYEVYRWV